MPAPWTSTVGSVTAADLDATLTANLTPPQLQALQEALTVLAADAGLPTG